ncbi:MAG TPA: YegS/Rv2252/BmrU family lipid kinase [Acidimicrobiia bacterium]|nr:YegS/Rv2252/BmrU family lipid kinase [Acidimicrobiia bacterium]
MSTDQTPTHQPSPTWLVAINPTAGRRAMTQARVAAALAESGIDAQIEVLPEAAAMSGLVAGLGASDHLAVVGGDGTVNLAVNALIETGRRDLPVLGVLPAGSGCDLLRTFGIPQDVEGAARHLAGGTTYLSDVGELTGSFGTRRFINIAQAGVGAAAAETASRLPRRLGSNRYLTGFGLRLARFPGGEVELITERRSHRGRALAVIMANAQFFAGGWNIAPKAMMVDGEFDLQVIDATKLTAPTLVPRFFKGLHLGLPGVRRFAAPWFRLETQHPWPVEVDGDPIGNTPIEGRVLPAAIRLKI